MRLLLDTHSLIWIATNDPRLSPAARTAYYEAEEVFWSIISLWEIGIKSGLQREDFLLDSNWMRSVPGEMELNGIQRLDINAEHCASTSSLPYLHRAPFDRMLVVQAMSNQLTIPTADSKIRNYPVSCIW